MSKIRQQKISVDIVEQEIIEEVLPALLSIQQVAAMQGRSLSPAFKDHHIPALLEFCHSTGRPSSGTEEEMLQTLAAFGFKK